MSVGCRGTILKSKHNLPSSVGSGCVWQFLKTPSFWTWKVILLVLILVWAWEFGFHKVSALAKERSVPSFSKPEAHILLKPWVPPFTPVNLHCLQWSPWLCIWLWDFSNQRGLCASKSWAQWRQAARKLPRPVMWFLYLWSPVPVALGLIHELLLACIPFTLWDFE